MKRYLKSLRLSVIVTTVLIAIGIITTFLVVNVAKIGYGGGAAPFLVGFSATFMVAAFIVSMWYAASDKSSTKLGMVIFAILLLIGLGIAVYGATLKNWNWSQFGYGAATLSLFLFGLAVVHVHKYGLLRKQSTDTSAATADSTETTQLHSAPDAAAVSA